MQPSNAEEFLGALFACLANPLLYEILPRKKNNDFLGKHGLKPWERDHILDHLTATDYRGGPEEDRDFPGEIDIWKFEKTYLGIKIYIKIKLEETEDGYYAKCMSFHD